MKPWILALLIALALVAIIVIGGLTQIRLDALQEPGRLSVSRDDSKTPPGSPKQPRGHSPSTHEFAGEHRGRRQTLRH